LKPERWGSPLVQEKYQEETACDKRQQEQEQQQQQQQQYSLKGEYLPIGHSFPFPLQFHSQALLCRIEMMPAAVCTDKR